MTDELVGIRRSDVPKYLQDGCFFQALNEYEDDFIFVPSLSMKADTVVNSYEDMINLLNSLRYWGVDGNWYNVVDFLLSCPEFDVKIPDLSAYEQNFQFISTLLKTLATPNRRPILVALQCGDIGMVKYFVEHGEELTAKCADVAAEHGHLHCLEYLHAQQCPWTGKTFTAAFHGGHLDCFKFAHQHGCPTSEFRLRKNATIDNVNYECFIYAYLNDFQVIQHTSILNQALFHNKLHSLRAGHAAGLPLRSALRGAVELGYIECTKYLVELGGVLDERLCQLAAGKGYLDVLQYLHEQGCPWDENTCMFAAYYGHLPCLRYAHAHGCPWNAKAYLNKNLDKYCRFYLLKHGCPVA